MPKENLKITSGQEVNNLVRGKLAVTVTTGLLPEIRDNVSETLALEARMDRMKLIGQLKVQGNLPCLTCGKGDMCEMSAVPLLFGENAKAFSDKCVRVEEQHDVWEEAKHPGHLIGDTIRNS